MKSSLIPEKPILVYPSLAATLGLEESVLLTVLSDLTHNLPGSPNNGYQWYQINRDTVINALPFWDVRDVQRVSTNLREKGVIIIASATLESSDVLKFAFNEKASSRPTSSIPIVNPTPTAENAAHRNFIPSHWQPSADNLAQLAQHSIPSRFALELVPEFVTYWRERKETHRSWGAKFVQHVLRKWRDFQARQATGKQPSHMTKGWKPSQDAWEFMVNHAGINREFIEDAIPEFIFYWMDRGEVNDNWNRKFYDHVRLQWARYNSAVENNTHPKPIPANWQPSAEVYDVLNMANIDLEFAKTLIPEFIIYWRDSNQVHTSWNTRFLQHAKRQWAKRHQLQDQAQENNVIQNRSTRDITLEEELSDRSWANS